LEWCGDFMHPEDVIFIRSLCDLFTSVAVIRGSFHGFVMGHCVHGSWVESEDFCYHVLFSENAWFWVNNGYSDGV